MTPNREVISQLDWLECRDLVLWGIDNRKPTPQELPGIRQWEEHKAEIDRHEAEKRRKFEEWQRQLMSGG